MNISRDQKKFDKFIKDRNETLAKNDIKELVKYFKRNCARKDYIEFKNASNYVKKATLCKMICSVSHFDGTDLQKRSQEWLKEHHMKNTVRVIERDRKIYIKEFPSDGEIK